MIAQRILLAALGGLCASLGACGVDGAAELAVPRAADTAAAHGGGACRLLTTAEVREAYPRVGDGASDATREQYGLDICEWEGGGGSLSAQIATVARGVSAEDEIRSVAEGFVDRARPDALANVRYERFSDLGEQAVAAVEPQDAQRGIKVAIVMLVVHRQGKSVTLMSSHVIEGDRDKTLATLRSLAGKAMARL